MTVEEEEVDLGAWGPGEVEGRELKLFLERGAVFGTEEGYQFQRM